MHVALAPILLFFFFRFCSAFFFATTAVFVLSSLLDMQRKCFCLRFHSFERMGHRQTNPTIAKKLKIKNDILTVSLIFFLGGGGNLFFAFCLSAADIPHFFRLNCEGGQLVQTDHPTSLRRKIQKMPLEKKKKDRWIFPGPGLLSAPLKISIGGGGGRI